MNIVGLVCPDAKEYPNIALMKIAGWHRSIGDMVEWYDPHQMDLFDKVYASSIFTYSDKSNIPIGCVIGGSGFNDFGVLPVEIEEATLDYSIYPACDYSLQRFSVGCHNNCKFCIVRRKEGDLKSVEPMVLNPAGEWITVIDNDFFGNPEWESAVMYLIEQGKPVAIQGVNARTFTGRNAFWLSKLSHKKQPKMAWDNPRENLLPKFRKIARWIRPYKVMVYILVGYDSTMEENLYRINELNGLGYDPFVMIYRDEVGTAPSRELRRLARWCNKKQHRGIAWGDYCKERGDRI